LVEVPYSNPYSGIVLPERCFPKESQEAAATMPP